MAYGTSTVREEITVTIPSGQSLSAAVNVSGKHIVGIKMPAGWDAASISFAALTRRDDTTVPPTDTYGKVQNQSGTEFVVTSPAADVYIAIDENQPVNALGWIKVRSGVAATPVNQTANRTLRLVLID